MDNQTLLSVHPPAIAKTRSKSSPTTAPQTYFVRLPAPNPPPKEKRISGAPKATGNQHDRHRLLRPDICDQQVNEQSRQAEA
jgi:hypothetical protein